MSVESESLQTAFTYDLPQERIAQRPVYPYDAARLLVVNPAAGTLEQGAFSGIDSFLQKGDLLVFNDTKVIPARLLGKRVDTGGQVELLLVREQSPGIWRALGKPLKRLRPGCELEFAAELTARVLERTGEQEVCIDFTASTVKVAQALQEAGLMPIPPYIRNGRSDVADRTDYQSLFARDEGSIAAPTASLHFTEPLLERLCGAGVETLTITLHVGPASFLPLSKPGRAAITPPGSEAFVVSDAAWQAICAAREQGRRVIAVGTTVVRALESRAADCTGETALFITPGYSFRVCDAIITNFHQPGTTHLLLVQAFIGRAMLERSYQYALDHDFRFLSYGDGMLLQNTAARHTDT